MLVALLQIQKILHSAGIYYPGFAGHPDSFTQCGCRQSSLNKVTILP